MAPFSSSGMISSSSSIATMVVSHTTHFFTPLYSVPPLGVKPSELSNDYWLQKTTIMGLSSAKIHSTKHLAILIQSKHVTHIQTDRWKCCSIYRASIMIHGLEHYPKNTRPFKIHAQCQGDRTVVTYGRRRTKQPLDHIRHTHFFKMADISDGPISKFKSRKLLNALESVIFLSTVSLLSYTVMVEVASHTGHLLRCVLQEFEVSEEKQLMRFVRLTLSSNAVFYMHGVPIKNSPLEKNLYSSSVSTDFSQTFILFNKKPS